MWYVTRIAIIGGGPGGYEAALVGAQLGAEVTLVERDGPGGACVLTDCVPSKTLIATSTRMAVLSESTSLGVQFSGGPDGEIGGAVVDLPLVNKRVRELAWAQSSDVDRRLTSAGVTVVRGDARLVDPQLVTVGKERIRADMVLVATGATPRILPGAEPDGERILNWRQLYELPELPDDLIVVGSGVTGAEFAAAYQALGSHVTLVSSRDRVLPHEDADAHCLMTVGMVPNTRGLGLEEAGVRLDERGFVVVDKVSRTSAGNVYAAGDCTGIMMLASVAAMQGRIAMWHSLGEAVQPLKLGWVAATIFTDPEVATVGVTQRMVDSGKVEARTVTLPLSTNARAKMQAFGDGFVKLFCRPATGIVLGGVIVAPRASELVLGLSVAVQQHLTVDQLAHTFAVYPSLSGSITEAARRLM